MQLFTIIIIIFLGLSSCSQKPVSITYKGHLKFFKRQDNVIIPKALVKNSKKEKRTLKLASDQIEVKKGDNLYMLARKYKLSTRHLIDQNNLKPPYMLKEGDILQIPSNRKTHIVVANETLTAISRKYDISITELAQINNIKMSETLIIGQILMLPYEAKLTHKQILNKKIFNVTVKNTKLIMPIQGEIITKFGPGADGTHNDGINIKANFGAPIKAAADGKIVYVGSELRGYGNLIIIKHEGNFLTAYAHNKEIFVNKNQQVSQGEIIGTVGKSGKVSEPQLHFGLRKGRKAVDPLKYIN
jgi:murein DD-endopeptidase MepM/ murein hydrolase activator NlpD